MKKNNLFIAFFCISFLSACMLPVEEEPLPPPIIKSYESAVYQYASVQRGDMVKYIDVSAQNIPAHEEHLSFSVSHILFDQINVKTGDYVKTGDLLAELDKTELIRQLDDARFQKAQLELKLRQTEEDYLLYKKYNNSTAAYENTYVKTYNDLATRIRMLDLEIETLNKRIDERSLKATMDGTVTYLRKTADGGRSTAGERLITITDTSLSVFAVTGPNAQYLKPGDKVMMRIYGHDFFETIVADPVEAGVYQPIENAAYFTLTNIPPEAASTNYATVRYIVEERKDVLYLPVKAVNTVNQSKFVYVMNNNIREMKPVETGLEDSSGKVEIKAGLIEGDSVILS